MGPNHLAVYLSNRCNLQCKYCYVAINQGEAVALSFEHLKANIDYFFSKVPPAERKITFLGGEPFMNFPLLQRAVDYSREHGGPDLILQTFTNGTNISQDKLDWLGARRVFVTVSLDGKKDVNDRNRVFFKSEGKSVFDHVMARLEGVSKEQLGVSLVFDSKSVGDLLKNVDFFYRQGFERITFNPELYEIWTPEKLELLKTVMQGFNRYYKAILTGGMRPFTVPILFSVLDKQKEGLNWWHECHNFVLGSDNQFYSCDKALTFTYDKVASGTAGSAASGMDWAKRGSDLKSAREVVDAVIGAGHQQYFCPMGVVFYSQFAGTGPEKLLRNFTAVSDIFGGALEEFIADMREHPVYRSLYEDVQRV